MNSRKQRAGMAVQNTLVGTGVFQDLSVEISQLRIDGSEGSDGMPLAQGKQILTAASGIGDIETDKSAVVKRDQGNGGGEGAAGVESLIDGIPALLQRQDANVGVLDRQQFQEPLTQLGVLTGEQIPPRRLALLRTCDSRLTAAGLRAGERNWRFRRPADWPRSACSRDTPRNHPRTGHSGSDRASTSRNRRQR